MFSASSSSAATDGSPAATLAGSAGVGGVTSVPCCQFTSARRGWNASQSFGHRHGASGARSRSHFRTVSPFGYVLDSKNLQPSRIGIGEIVPDPATRQQVEPTSPSANAAFHPPTPPLHGFGRLRQPTLPSIWSSMRRDHSTAYSMGSVRVTGSMNPLTTIDMACSSVRPRLIR